MRDLARSTGAAIGAPCVLCGSELGCLHVVGCTDGRNGLVPLHASQRFHVRLWRSACVAAGVHRTRRRAVLQAARQRLGQRHDAAPGLARHRARLEPATRPRGRRLVGHPLSGQPIVAPRGANPNPSPSPSPSPDPSPSPSPSPDPNPSPSPSPNPNQARSTCTSR